METIERMKRWRLILGEESESRFQSMEGGGGAALSPEQWQMDQALAAIYNQNSAGGFGPGGPGARGVAERPRSLEKKTNVSRETFCATKKRDKQE